MATQGENTAGSTWGRKGIQLLLLIGILMAVVGLVKVAGGFPPQPWIFLVQMLPRLPLLWKARGMAMLLPLGALLLVALSLLLAWLLLFYFLVRVGKGLLVPRRVNLVLAAGEEWSGESWQMKDHDERTRPMVRPLGEQMLEGKGNARVSSGRLLLQTEGREAGLQGKRKTEPLMRTRKSEEPILGARERYYARFSEPETQPLDVMTIAYEHQQRTQATRQEVATTLMRGSGPRWWVQEGVGPCEDEGGKEREERWWMQMEMGEQEESDDLPTTEPGQDEKSDPAFMVKSTDDEVIGGRETHSLLEREGDDRVDVIRGGRESEVDARPVAFIFGVGLDVGITHKGSPNEDCVFATTGVRMTKSESEPTGLFMVADGLGGHEQGREASQLAVSAVSDALLPCVLHETANGRQEEEILGEGVRCANATLFQRNCEQSTSMGTTLTAVLLVGRKAYVVNVGDSRTYLYRPGEGLRQVTRDHSLVMRMVEVGAIAREDLYVHPLRNQVYRSLGNAGEVEVETTVLDMREGDVLLLCSDGLWEMVRDDEIEEIIRRGGGPSGVSGRLVQAALRNGGADNIGLVVVSIVAGDI